MVASSYSSSYQVLKDIWKLDAPPFKESLLNVPALSDVLGIVSKDIAGEQKTDSLEYIIRYKIATDDTKYIMKQEAKVEEDQLNAPWPSKSMLKGTLEF